MCFYAGCGFLNNSGVGAFDSRREGGDSGDGRAPRLSERRNADQLKNHDCEIDDDCKRACQEIYDELHSYEDCYELSYGSVSDMQNVFRALTEEDDEYQRDLLNKVDADAFELYLDVGINGFRDEAISLIEEYSDKTNNYKGILIWLSQSVNLVKILQRKDPRNEILEALLLNYAEANEASCSNTPLQVCTLSSPGVEYSICGCATTAQKIHLESGGDMIVDGRVIASVESSQVELLKALSFIDSGNWNFLLHSAGNSSREHAFIWAYELIEEACANNHRDFAHQCISGMLCWIKDLSPNGVPIDKNLMTPEVVNEVSGCLFVNPLVK